MTQAQQVFHTKDEVIWQSQKWEVVGQDTVFLYALPTENGRLAMGLQAIPRSEARALSDPMARDEAAWATQHGTGVRRSWSGD